MGSDTMEINKASKSLFWKVAYLLLTGILGFYLYWSFTEINSSSEANSRLESEVKSLSKENQAQWMLLRESSDKQRSLEIELEVTSRLFRMLVEQGDVKLKVREPADPVTPSVSKNPRRPEELEAFRNMQMAEYEQSVMMRH